MTSTGTGFTDEELEESQDTPINQINGYLFLGSIDAREPEILSENNITDIIRLTNRKDNVPIPPNVVQTTYYIPDLRSESITLKAHDIIEAARVSNKRILVHCQAGISRSATIVIGHLMLRTDEIHGDISKNIPNKRMTLVEAFDYVEERRPCIWPNSGFWKELLQLDEVLEKGLISLDKEELIQLEEEHI